MKKISLLIAVLALLSLTLLQGCFIAAAGGAAVGTVAYIRGDFEAILDEQIGDVYEATKLAYKDLEIHIVGTDKDALTAVVNGRGAEDKKISTRMERVEQGRLVKLSIRIDMFGDETFSKIIYNKINYYLPQVRGAKAPY